MFQNLFTLNSLITFLSEFNMNTSSPDDIKMTIVYFVRAALKKQIPWSVLDNFLDEVTLNLEKSKKVIKILLEIIQDEQESNIDKVTNDLSHDQPNSVEVLTVDEINFEEEKIEIIEEKKASEELMQMTFLNDEGDILNESEDNRSENTFSEADSEHEEPSHEMDVSKNIQLLEAFKGQFYTFVGDNSEEKSAKDGVDQSIYLDEKSEEGMDLEAHSKAVKNKLNEKILECETCGKSFKDKSKLKTHTYSNSHR